MSSYKHQQGLRQHATGRVDVFKIDPRIIEIDENYNVRGEDNFGDIEGLAMSIMANGLQVPLRVRCEGERVLLRAGHRRMRAIRYLIDCGHDIKSVPAVPEPKNWSEAQSCLDLIVSNDGLSLTPLEQGRVFQRLVNFGWTAPQVAEKSGKCLATINNYLRLAGSNPIIQQRVEEKRIAPATVMEVMRQHSSETRQVAAVEKAISKAESEGEFKATARHIKRPFRKTKSDWKLVKLLLTDTIEALRTARHAKVVDFDLRFKRLFGEES